MEKIYNWIKRPLILVLMVVLIIFLINRTNILNGIGSWFTQKPLLIDNTPLVIKEIKAIAELNTATMYQEIIVDSVAVMPGKIPVIINPSTMAPKIITTRKEIVLIVKGRVKAGVDLKSLSDSSVFVQADSVSIQLPTAKITDIFLNPSDIETFYEEGVWNNEEVTAVKQSARRKLLAEADRQQLLKKANDKAKAVVEQFLRAAQFKKIHFR